MKRHVLLTIAYGNKRVNCYYEVPVECAQDKTDWCNANIGYHSWFYSRVNGYPSYYFVHKKHATFFALRWA